MRRQCNGAKPGTEVTDLHRKVEVVGEHSAYRRREAVRLAGGSRRENAGMSRRKDG
jgi:hypothetical protein